MYSNNIDKETLKEVIKKEELIDIINKKHILPQNSLLNDKTKMDAENYYVQTGDMKDINELIKKIKGE